jgi:CIC family chloride channel protein
VTTPRRALLVSRAVERSRLASARWYRGLLLAAGVGVLTGLAVAAFDVVTADLLFDHVAEAPALVWLVAPTAGLAVAAWALRTLAPGASPATSDEYVRYFHERGRRLPLRPVPGKVLASVATLGSGGALGYEGPAIYVGAAIGSAVQRRFTRLFSREDAKVMLVAGAAAGVAAIFRAPATAAVYALTAPYQESSAGRATLPALVASATSYVTFVAVKGTTQPLFRVPGNPGFGFNDLAAAALLGLCCGVGARGFAWLLDRAKAIAAATPAVPRILVAGGCLAGLAALTNAVYGTPLALGSGYRAVAWADEPAHALGLVALLLAVRAVASFVTLAGGGVGGTFVPLVVLGVLLGHLLGSALGGDAATLLPLVGMAAFLGAGYRTPIAAVMFVAESTGRPGFVVPGLIATAIAQLVMGRASVSAYQRPAQAGHLERRLDMPVTAAVTTGVYTCAPGTTVSELLHVDFVAARAESIPVVSGGRYLGMVSLDDVADVPRERRDAVTAAELAAHEHPVVRSDATLRAAVAAMEASDVDRVPVVDDGVLLGVVTTADIVGLDQVIEDAAPR